VFRQSQSHKPKHDDAIKKEHSSQTEREREREREIIIIKSIVFATRSPFQYRDKKAKNHNTGYTRTAYIHASKRAKGRISFHSNRKKKLPPQAYCNTHIHIVCVAIHDRRTPYPSVSKNEAKKKKRKKTKWGENKMGMGEKTKYLHSSNSLYKTTTDLLRIVLVLLLLLWRGLAE
jgi:hypothetical protein